DPLAGLGEVGQEFCGAGMIDLRARRHVDGQAGACLAVPAACTPGAPTLGAELLVPRIAVQGVHALHGLHVDAPPPPAITAVWTAPGDVFLAAEMRRSIAALPRADDDLDAVTKHR